MTRACDKICDVLIEAGIEYVFGIPGGGTMPVWEAMYQRQDKLKVILTRHEGGAACMADMYGRMTGKPALLMGQGAFIASNGAFGILEGLLSHSPMLVITDTSDAGFSQSGNYQSGTGEYGSYDIVSMMRAMTKFTSYAVNPFEAVHGVQLAIKHATLGSGGPCCVVGRNEALDGEFNSASAARIYNTGAFLKKSIGTLPQEYMEEASELINQAKNPVIIAGNGVHLGKAYDELTELAELLNIPVATSYTGKSAFPEIHPLAVGMMGTFGQTAANRVIAAADLLLVMGCRLSPSDTLYQSSKLINPEKQQIIQIDVEPGNTGLNYPVTLGLNGDVKVVLGQLLDTLKKRESGTGARVAARLDALAGIKKEENFCEAPELHADDVPILPERIVHEIENSIDPSTIVTLDAGNNRLWVSHFFRSKQAGTFFCPGGVAGMGWAPPAALAAKLLNPERPILAISSDGGFGMMIHVLSTAMQYHLPVTFLVMNNSGLGMVRDSQRGKTIASEFVKTDFAAIARAFGCQGITVEQPGDIGGAIKQGMASQLPTLIDVITSPSEPYFKIANS